MTKRSDRIVIISASCALLMFGFSFALSPLYRVVCRATGLNGGINVSEVQNNNPIDTASLSREVTVQFVATNNRNLPWEFHPEKNSITVHPNETFKVLFYAKNNSNHQMTVQATPSFSPPISAKYFHKIECFCFSQQTLAAGEAKEMPLVFRVDSLLKSDIRTITLGYTLFDVTTKRIL